MRSAKKQVCYLFVNDSLNQLFEISRNILNARAIVLDKIPRRTAAEYRVYDIFRNQSGGSIQTGRWWPTSLNRRSRNACWRKSKTILSDFHFDYRVSIFIWNLRIISFLKCNLLFRRMHPRRVFKLTLSTTRPISFSVVNSNTKSRHALLRRCGGGVTELLFVKPFVVSRESAGNVAVWKEQNNSLMHWYAIIRGKKSTHLA